MRRLLLVPLVILCMADDCDPPKKAGVQGTPCYENGSCDHGLTCLQWKNHDGSHHSVCAAPQDIVVGYTELVSVKCDQKPPECPKCPDPPVVHITELRCPQPPPPVHCPPPVRCPPVPIGPCPECKACEPGWKRPK